VLEGADEHLRDTMRRKPLLDNLADWRLVLLAALVCFLASVTAINLFRCAQSTTGRGRAAWIVTAGAATGCGIWATHFIAMLAYEPGVPTGYDIGLTALSLVVAIGITCIGLSVPAYRPNRWSAPAGGAILGGGIAFLGQGLPSLIGAAEISGLVGGNAGFIVRLSRRNAESDCSDHGGQQ
jgi:hypothetical protein